MSIPRAARLVEELHCLSPNGPVVITAQRWTAGGGRSWLRVLRNGQPQMNRGRPVDVQYSGAARTEELDREMERIRAAFAPTVLDEVAAWSKVAEFTGVDRSRCQRGDRCAAPQIMGWPYCPACGANGRRVAAGSMSGVRGRMVAHPVVFTPSDK